MDKIILIIVLVLLCSVLIAALKKKNIIEFIRSITAKKIPKIKFDHRGTKQARGHTIILPDLFMYQLNADGTYSHVFELFKTDMIKNDQLVGIPISRPGADCEEILLCGKQTSSGEFDKNDPATYAALTVPTRAVVIGYDDNGIYGEVTNQKARVYAAYLKEGKIHTEYIAYGETFDIEDGSYLLIGEQWLYFKMSKPVQFPGMISVDAANAADTAPDPPVPANARKESRIGMHKRKTKAERGAATKVMAPSVGQAVPENNSNSRYRFPLEE